MFIFSLFIGLVSFCAKDSMPGADVAFVSSGLNKKIMLQLVNDARRKGCNCGRKYYGAVPALTWNSQLEKAAFKHSNDMFRYRYFGHTGSDGSGSGERISNAGYSWRYFGENIAQGYLTEKQVVAGWLSSPGHCANIMNRNFKEMGAAKVGDYWTQDFGSKR